MKRFLRPAKGIGVRHPQTREAVPTAGAWVEDGSYWRRRILAGDLEDLTDEKSKPKPRARARQGGEG